MTSKKKVLALLTGCCAVGAFSGCGADNTATTVDTVTQTTTSDDSDSAVEIVKNDNLAVDPQKCIGCGKCARIASDNFEMNRSTHKAEVISQEITSQASVSQAAQACPTSAITT